MGIPTLWPDNEGTRGAILPAVAGLGRQAPRGFSPVRDLKGLPAVSGPFSLEVVSGYSS